MHKINYDDSTKIIKDTVRPDPATGAANSPVYLSSTFAQQDPTKLGKYDYARSGNPTRDQVEESIAHLEGGSRGFAFATGMAAISAAFLSLHQGDHIIVTKDVYGGTFRLVTQLLPNYGISHTFVDLNDKEALEAAYQENTKVVYAETPSNPTLTVVDLAAIAQSAHAHGALLFADNTFMTPLYQKPLELGADLVLHSATKFLSGHSDILAGLVVTKDDKLGEEIYFIQNAMGATLGVSDCWLLLRGLKTLKVRMKAETEGATELAGWLEQQSAVAGVHYPGLRSDPNYAIQSKQAASGGAVLSFDVGSEENVRTLVQHLRLPLFSVSLGAVETILSYPCTMSHAELDAGEQEASGITPGLLRLSVGIEDLEDLKADFKQALAFLPAADQERQVNYS
ncbi:cystathionine beta-lyase [Ligilactobacillus salitolerans]|uniref:cysteine-S-conjugate beta-lyase n=1 Tax=Ligilactobacillus salitolerans TaxID=1808352 RepID=A0A401IW04_9LACO|nr:aminotransferase class I/II-fold pyridoxal phosphate-dependent enzyme [Ligilactobacillus salitolerans]GBG95741.1 cystathionine beta-lyase [Ligilactobacillus salitolerans]